MKAIKSYRVIVVFALVLIAFSSCKKYLQENPVSNYDAEYVFSNTSNALKAVLGVYQTLAGDAAYGNRLSGFYAFDTDEMTGNGGLPDNSRRDIAKYNVSPVNTELPAVFEKFYTGIERANICIKFIPAMELYKNGSDLQKKQLQRMHGECLALRAQFYLDLIRIWGDLPAQFVPSSDLPDLFLEKTDRDTIYNHILEDLRIAEDLVPWRTEVTALGDPINERLTKGAIKGLRARVALFRGGYSLRRQTHMMERRSDYLTYYAIAKKECEEIMDRRDQHTLCPTFEAIFKDNICSHKLDPTGELMFMVAMAGGTADADSRLGFYNGTKFGSRGAACRINVNYFYLFDSVDSRRDVTCTPYATAVDGTKLGLRLDIMNDGKFRLDWVTPAISPANPPTYNGIGYPLLRFSDVLLMYAEADNEINGAPSAKAKAAFEEVRKRGYGTFSSRIGMTPSDKAGFFDAIVKERSLEFGGEYIRKYDLLRWNLLKTKLDEAKAIINAMIAKTPPWQNLPASMYYKVGATPNVWVNSFYTTAPVATPAGSTKLVWISSTILGTAYQANIATFFTPGKSELFPIPQSSIDANYKLTQDF